MVVTVAGVVAMLGIELGVPSRMTGPCIVRMSQVLSWLSWLSVLPSLVSGVLRWGCEVLRRPNTGVVGLHIHGREKIG